MKRSVVWIALVLINFTLSTSVFAEVQAEYAGCLYPIRVDGKWGYMNYAGETIITPEWAYAGEFANGAAVVSAKGSAEDDTDGLIDTKGEYILPPRYSIEQNGAFSRVRATGEDGLLLDGYYDALSRCFLPPAYDLIDMRVTDDTPLIVAFRNGLCGFLDRATGKAVIPLQYTGEVEDAGYSEGYILAADAVHWEDGGLTFRIYLLDTRGNEVRFPEGIMASSGVHEGLLRIEREAQEGESSTWGTLYGFARPDGSILVPPKYDYAEDFYNGYAAVYKDGKWGHIDEAGREIVLPVYDLETYGALYGYYFYGGYAILELTDRWIILDTEGNVVFERAAQENGVNFAMEDWCGLGSGLVWYSHWQGKEWQGRRFGLMKADGTMVTEAIWEEYAENDPEDGIAFDQEGLQAVKRSGLWRYIDATGAGSLPFEWDYAENFSNGLAYVEKNGKMEYIDHRGNVVWQEE